MLSIGGRWRAVIDWVVVMNRFPRRFHLFDNLAKEKRQLEASVMTSLAADYRAISLSTAKRVLRSFGW